MGRFKGPLTHEVVKKRSRACKDTNEKLSDSAACKEALLKGLLGIKSKNDKK